ncbi:hypothetical protein LTR85_002471 [Meristemomyces frigidus]|nr:hypothetical protein LTR85_002471 [Meristemomyces frigidus]
MHSFLVWTATLLLCAPNVLANPKVVSMRLGRRERPTIRKRDPQAVTLGNVLTLYYVNATVGTPGQVVALDIDTGSSDVWMFGPDVYQSCAQCLGGSYDPSQSRSYSLIAAGAFSIQYVTPGSGVTGDYFADVFTLGGMTMQNLTMAVATDAAAVRTGIMGIGFDTDESIVQNDGTQAYPNIIDVMVQQQLINSRAYSLYLDDLAEANTGAVIFGGYDTEKYTGDLTILDIQPDAESGGITSFTVAWSLLAVTDSTGTYVVSQADFPLPAVLDSGTTLTIVPSDIFDELANYFGAVDNSDYGYLVGCSNAQLNGTVDYQFGGDSGPIISVPFSELAVPLYDDQGNPLTFDDGSAACEFGFAPAAEGSPILFGDTFLRSAYVVYDLDARQIGIANSAWNSDASNIQEIGSSSNGGNAVSAASSAMGVSVTQTASANIEPGIGSGGTGTVVHASSSAVGSHTVGAKTTLGGAGGVHGTASSSSSSTATGSASSAASSSAAPPSLPSNFSSVLFVVLVNILALMLGGAAVFLVA